MAVTNEVARFRWALNGIDQWNLPPTDRNALVQKVAYFGLLLGGGILLAYFVMATLPVSVLLAGAVITILSGAFLHFQKNIDKKDDNGHTKLTDLIWHDRILAGHRLHLLLALGANPNAVGTNNDMPLHLAAYQNRPDLVELLLRNGAEPDQTGNMNRTPLYYAVQAKSDGAVGMLMGRSANPNKISGYGNSPLQEALRKQEWYRNNPMVDGVIGGDRRTREERIAAVNRIVQLLQRERPQG